MDQNETLLFHSFIQQISVCFRHVPGTVIAPRLRTRITEIGVRVASHVESSEKSDLLFQSLKRRRKMLPLRDAV